MGPIPKRGFEVAEFEGRMQKVQSRMRSDNIDAILLTTEADIRYFTGFFSQFWQSPTRPWFVILPLDTKPIAIIPEIGVAGMADCWVEKIYSWPAPRPKDDGISQLKSVFEKLPKRFSKIGIPLGHESFLRMPAGDYQRLLQGLGAVDICDVSLMLHQLRFIKSPAEIEKIEHICHLASDCFEELPNVMKIGESEREICHRMRIDFLKRGADHTPFLVSGSGPGGYDSIIMGPGERKLEFGDLLIIDTGSTFDGYFCDFDRNFAFGHADDPVLRAYDGVYRATQAGLEAARPGITTGDLFHIMWKILQEAGALGNSVGRLGHGLGMELTEWPSITPNDGVLLEPGAVITLEPGMEFAQGKQMVHEENILITQDGVRLLSRRASAELAIVS